MYRKWIKQWLFNDSNKGINLFLVVLFGALKSVPHAQHDLLGSLSNSAAHKDDGNGNDDARKQCSDWLNEENNRAARAARTLIQFFDVVGQMTTWNFQIYGFNDNVNRQQKIFHSLYLLQRRLYQSISRVLCEK